MAGHNGNAEGKRLSRMAATFMMRFTPPVPHKPEDPPHPGEESKSSDLCNLVYIGEASDVGPQPLDSPPEVEDLESDRDSPSLWSLPDIPGWENISGDSADETPRRDQATEGIIDE